MARYQTHTVLLTVRFNKKISERAAVAAVRDCVHGEFYPTPDRTDGADQFRVSSVKRVRKEKL